jgi:hypothetical protein
LYAICTNVLEACWAEPLHDLGDGDAALHGILAPGGRSRCAAATA